MRAASMVAWIVLVLSIPTRAADPPAAGAAGVAPTVPAGQQGVRGPIGPRLDPGDTPATATPLLNTWQARIGNLIDRAEQSGCLKPAEAKRFRARLDDLSRNEARAKRNGILDTEERRRLGAAARALADEIYRKADMGAPPAPAGDAGAGRPR